MTRARKSLTLTRAVYRRIFGNEQQSARRSHRASSPKFPANSWTPFAAPWPRSAKPAATNRIPNTPTPPKNSPAASAAHRLQAACRRAALQVRQNASFGKSASAPSAKNRRQCQPHARPKSPPPEYGVGTVVGVEGDEDDRKLAVTFPGRGTKKFIERYAQLELA